MFFRTSIQRYMAATLLLLVLPLALGAVLLTSYALREVGASARTTQLAIADKTLLLMASNMRSQRGDLQTAILASDDPRALIKERNASSDVAVKSAIESLRATDLIRRDELTKALESNWIATTPLYADLTAEGAKPKDQRNLAATSTWYDGMERTIGSVIAASTATSTAIRKVDPKLAELQDFKQNAWDIRANYGSQCTALRPVYASGKPLDVAQARKLGDLRGRVSLSSSNLAALAGRSGISEALKANTLAAITSVEKYSKQADDLLGKLGGGSSPIGAAEWTKLCNEPFGDILNVVSTSLDETIAQADGAHDNAMMKLAGTILGALAIFGIGLASWLGLRNRVSRPVVDIRATLERLQAGNLDEAVAPARYPDEIGALSSALETYRENALQLEQARKEREGLQEHQLREAASGQALVANVAKVVAGAKDGDFSGRIDVAGVTGSLRELAEGVNAINTVVDQATIELADVLRAIADGDLTHTITSRHAGRFGELREAVNDTVARLSQTVATIQSTAAEVSSSAREINSGADDLSRRAEDQASSLEETAATTEELAASVKSSAQSSRQAVAMANEAMQVAETGGRIIADAVEAMAGIEQAAGKIADITSVIDSIAFQTNLLALNAAVEAARAGDAGKGFAVVASEVRTLAQRSGEASKDISHLIQSSTEQVATGVKLVREAGEALSKIVDASKNVSATVAEISTAASEQANGIEEMSQTVAHLDGTTQQNAALAVESAASATALNDLIQQLNALVAAFKTGSSSTVHHVRKAAA